ncbi:MAG: hypothetical protein QM647_15035 [Asticcacaulis sp.]|uniref:hypothetical protein n=1 Tax=Asticcacaulis sp. TaxID=1872648 RepID=UPI0039E65999
MTDAAQIERALRLQIEALTFQRNKAQDEVAELYAQKQQLAAELAVQNAYLQGKIAELTAELAELKPPVIVAEVLEAAE